ncbi:hypothetical protein Salat_0643100 [Sesamum alatum]|uniref:Uncharacterized protein n=1 Tax=Sesamum alatum TaxID=300844 RepID=A0AAE1YRE1_9LAMI|nr:hypothetical protein Salat_0643100 [Sesamum alatum]
MQMLTAMQAQSPACGKSCNKGLMMVIGLINGKKAVNSNVVTVSRFANTKLRIGPWHGQCGNRPTFVKGECSETRPLKASLSKEGAYSPQVAGFCCIETMQEEMDVRWANAQ